MFWGAFVLRGSLRSGGELPGSEADGRRRLQRPTFVRNWPIVFFFGTRSKHHNRQVQRAAAVKRLTGLIHWQATAQRHCARRRRVVLFLLGKKARPQQSERSGQFRRGPDLCVRAKFGMVY
jgi:hypothetical protein